ncbi:helix-turn-helix domain-containing protein [Chryseobacterium glaciei]
MMQKIGSPDYKKIYNDIIARKYPEKREQCNPILSKQELSFLDIIKLNSLLFDVKNKEISLSNQRHKSYDISAIHEILEYQIKNKLNNSQLSIHFQLSRNTIAKWKKLFYPIL